MLIEQAQRSQIQEFQDEYINLAKNMLDAADIQVQYEAIKSYIKLLKVMPKNSFDETWK